MSRYADSTHSGSSRSRHSSSSSSSSSSSMSYSRYGDGYHDGAVTRHVDENDGFATRFFAHMLRGPWGSKKPRRRKGRGHRHHGRSRSSSSPPYSPPQPGPPPPPPPGMMRPGGFGPGGQGFVQMNGNGGGVPQQPPMPRDPIWGIPQQQQQQRQQQQQQQYGARRAYPPYPLSPEVVLVG